MPDRFNIVVKYVDGSTALLTTGPQCRLEWCRKTANKHIKECARMIVNGERPTWLYVALSKV